MLKTVKYLIFIPAMVLVSPCVIQAGTKFFSNFTERDLTITLAAGKEIVTTVVHPGETKLLDYKNELADKINYKTPPGEGKMYEQDLVDEDGINTNTQFFFTRKGVKMSPRNPLDRMKIAYKKKKGVSAGDKKEKADIAADQKIMRELDTQGNSAN